MDVGNLTAKLTLETAGFEKSITGVGDMTKKLATGVGASLGAVTAAVGTATAAAAAAVGSLVKDAVAGFGEFEQLASGAQKIFDEMDYSKIESDAANAWETMNLSASQYLSMINQVGATFAQTMGDEKGYETAKAGMQAIADYASGTGRNVEELNQKFAMITRAASSYQSIADQFSGILPATSADFLKAAQSAGLLSNAYEKLTEVPVAEYQEAVSKMLEKGVADLNLTGNTAKETANTITGSIAGLKATWQNLIVGLADSNADLNKLINDVVAQAEAVIQNVLPALIQALYGIGDLVMQLVPIIAERLPELISTLVPMLVETAVYITQALVENLPLLVQVIAASLMENLPLLVNAVVLTLNTLLTSILPTLLEVAVELVLALARGLLDNMDLLMASVTDLMVGAVNTILNHLPEFLALGVQIVIKIVEGILLAIPRLIGAVAQFLGIIDDSATRITKDSNDVTSVLERDSKTIADNTATMSRDYETSLNRMINTNSAFKKSTETANEVAKKVTVNVYDANGNITRSFETTATAVTKTTSDMAQNTEQKQRYLEAAMKSVSDSSNNASSSVNSSMNDISKSAKDAASAVESAVNRMNSAMGSINGGELLIGHRASGGPVSAGMPYMTGEEGRELFVPATDGYILNNDDTEDLMTQAGGVTVIIQGDVYDDERSLRQKMQSAVLGILQEQIAYA